MRLEQALIALGAASVLLAGCAEPERRKALREIPEEPWTLADKAGGAKRPFAALEALLAASGRFAGKAPGEASNYWQAVATFRSFVGEDRLAVAAFTTAMGTAAPSSEGLPEGLAVRDAVEAILEAASTRRAVFLNESHHIARDRAFSKRLLRGLRERGYRYFAAETFRTQDEGLAGRRYPVVERTGYYIHEPVFGELVREALRLGFKPVAYEDERPCDYDPADPARCQNYREAGQAENLRDRILKSDPEARIFVHAGYGHITRSAGRWGEKGEWTPMAFVFERLTGIAPLAVDQTEFTEASEPGLEKGLYRAALERFRPAEPVVLVSSSGAPWVQRPGDYDLQVVHPRTAYEQGRPTWLTGWTQRRLVGLPAALLGVKTPFAVEAYSVAESSDAVPWDRIVVRDLSAPPALALPPGRYILRSGSAGGSPLGEATLAVE